MAKVIYTKHNQLITKGTYTMRNKVISLVAVAVAAGTVGVASSHHQQPAKAATKPAATTSPLQVKPTTSTASNLQPAANPQANNYNPQTNVKSATTVGTAATGGTSHATPTPSPTPTLHNNPRY